MLKSTSHFEEKLPYLILCYNLPPLLNSAITNVTHSVPPSQFKQIIIEVSLLTQLALYIQVATLFPSLINFNTV